MPKENLNKDTFYELVILVKPEENKSQASSHLNQLINDTVGNKNQIKKFEYWGSRKLAYKIRDNTKAHYFFYGLACGSDIMEQTLKKKLISSNKILRHIVIKVKDIDCKNPSPILANLEETKDENNN